MRTTMSMRFHLVKKSLSRLLQEYRSLRPNLSLRSLSRNIGVNRYFLAKLLDENDKVKLHLDEMLIFYKFIKENLPSHPSVNKELSVIQNFFSDHLGNSEYKFLTVDKNAEVDLQDRFNFLIFVLACCDYGFSKEKIVSVLGENCVQNINDLLQAGHIEETESGKIRVKNGAPICFSSAVVLQHIGDLFNFYRLNHREQNRNFLNIRIQSLTKEALEKVVEIQNDCDRKIYDIIIDEKNIGPNPMFSLGCVDTFTDELV